MVTEGQRLEAGLTWPVPFGHLYGLEKTDQVGDGCAAFASLFAASLQRAVRAGAGPAFYAIGYARKHAARIQYRSDGPWGTLGKRTAGAKP